MADISTYLAVLTSEHSQKPNFVAMVSLFCQASVDQQNVLAAFPTLFDKDMAVGDQLDKIGQWVGVSRHLNRMVLGVDTLDDTAYRVLINLFIAENTWDGTVPGIYDIWNAILASTYGPILVDDFQDMTMAIVLLVPPASLLILAILIEGYFTMRPAGVGIIGFFTPSITGPVFGLDVQSSTIQGFDDGAWVIPIVV